MYDAASLYEPAAHQRAVGELRVTLRRRGARTVLEDLRQAGCLKARFPHRANTAWLDVAMLNISGGVAGGDRLCCNFAARPGAQVSIAAQAAERFYRALPGAAPAHIRTDIMVDSGAAVEWLPQEAILFDHCALDRRLTARLHGDACFLGLEMLILGRAAMGETVERADIADAIHIYRDDRPILWDAIRLRGEVARLLARPAVAHGARAMATLVMVAPDAPSRLDELREVLAAAPGDANASCWDGMLVARALAESGAALRQTMIAALHVLRDGRALPRVWMC